MSVNWQLKKPANNCTGMYWAAKHWTQSYC